MAQGEKTHDLLAAGPGAFKEGLVEVGFRDGDARREGLCGERAGDVKEAAERAREGEGHLIDD
jgi:hypothetical protein